MKSATTQVAVVGSGFGALSAAALLAKAGLQVTVLEQNNYPGGCASSYKRKGYWFETGATTLVGLDEHMPLHYLLQETRISIPAQRLALPMQVVLKDGTRVTRFPHLEAWIQEAERVFGVPGQRSFWETCYRLSQKVWRTSVRQQSFPFSSLSDVWQAVKALQPEQVGLLPLAFKTVQELLQAHGLDQNQPFVEFVDQQLLITAQNTRQEVNALFGATALCYTLYGNYFMPGGLRQLSEPLIAYLRERQGQIHYKTQVERVEAQGNGYLLHTSRGHLLADYVVLGVPLNNVFDLFPAPEIRRKLKPYLLSPAEVNGAFTWSLVFRREQPLEVLHHQLHVPGGVPQIGSESIFVSLSHTDDHARAPQGFCVASVSTHVPNPPSTWITDKKPLEAWVVSFLAKAGFFQPEQVVLVQSATPGAWLDWTGRAWGQVGGYPQFRRIKPWQMKDARLDGRRAYVCGDTVYPGQGIPGVCLSGIIAAQKLLRDHF
ncbi:phytoene desaturase family protein [Rufibacter quisquiliarum]|uniref:C-3',4' desaturase CrtD n=1 Tax=Rufibacter quisquiliarum TaxID=1549639 RepID=A0A839GU80_9BACT|nr:NAD(P)/FAD-dependent oxidoreductase [Rufibacter quisquiliarum]MBA9077958.1 C-3',4' desaturase CrtD [Rufibacter quisquiliarum]